MNSRFVLVGYALGGLAVCALLLLVYLDPTRSDVPLGQENRVLPYHDSRNRTLRDVVTRITILNGMSRTTVEKGEAGQWRLVEPVAARADQAAVVKLLDLFTKLERVASVRLPDTSWETLSKYGLAPIELKCVIALGDETMSLVVGGHAPGRSRKEERVYVRVGDSTTVDVVDDKPVCDMTVMVFNSLRDRSVFPHGVSQARRVRIEGPNGEIVLEDVREHWRLVKPREGRVDTDALLALLKAMHELRVASYESQPQNGGGGTGLEKPALTCTLETWDDERATLRVGRAVEANKGRVYADSTGQAGLFTLKSDDLRGLSVRPDDLRERESDAKGEAKPDAKKEAKEQ